MSGNEFMQYQSRIDGLRAFAVASVLLFHAGITGSGPTILPGGHFGVDVFFVISGFLISRILFDEIHATGRLDFLRFYERRVRRIMPALIVVMICCLPAVLVLSPAEQGAGFRDSALAAALSLSNIYFLYTTTDYNAGNAQLLPLLHTWSLGVEAQFYLLFPAVLLGMHRIVPHFHMVALAGLFAASFVACLWLLPRDPDMTFYLPFTRFWELLAGSLAALLQGRLALSARARTSLSTAAGATILLSFFLPKSLGQHPGLLTLLPMAATATLLLCAVDGTPTARVLSFAPFVWLGRISYSAYLWHFPLLAFARQTLNDPSLPVKLGLVAVSLGLAALSYRFVEQPFRNSRTCGRPRLWGSLAAGAGLLVAGSVAVALPALQDRLPKLLAPLQGEITAGFDVPAMQKRSEVLSRQRSAFAEPNKTNVLVIGNSHSRSAFNAFEQRKQNWPAAEFLRGPIQLSCFDVNDAANAPVAAEFFASDNYSKADVVIVATRLRHKQTCYSGPMKRDWIHDYDGLGALLVRLRADGKKAVVFGPTREFKGADVDSSLYGPLRTNLLLDRRDRLETDAAFAAKIAEGINRTAFRQLLDQTELHRRVEAIARAGGAEFVDLAPLLCDGAAQSCHAMTPAGERAFADTNHLTVEGSAFLGDRLVEAGLPARLGAAAERGGP